MDLILTDVPLPAMLVRKLKADHATAAIPVGVVAREKADGPMLECSAAGADFCLHHPVVAAELLNCVSGILNK